eukprot:scaffold618_cov130-Cylindrotheca_fusiformis.AAC.30
MSHQKKNAWSPHTSALHRRRRGSAVDRSKILGSLSDIGDDLFPTDTHNPAATISKKEKRRSQEDIPLEIQKKLAILTDPETPMKRRLEIEVEMMKNPEEKSIFSEFRHDFDRKKYLTEKEMRDKEEEEQMKKNMSEEAKRAAAEKEEFMKARQAELDAERAKKEREMKVQQEVELHRKMTVAKDSEALRKNAESVVAKVAEKKAREKLEEEERQARLLEFRRKEGAQMPHVNRVLTEALLEQQETKN